MTVFSVFKQPERKSYSMSNMIYEESQLFLDSLNMHLPTNLRINNASTISLLQSSTKSSLYYTREMFQFCSVSSYTLARSMMPH